MTNFIERWAKLRHRRPTLCDESAEVTFVVANLRSLAEAFYDAGAKDVDDARNVLRRGGRDKSPADDLLRRFGL